MIRTLIILIVLSAPFSVDAQHRRMKKKVSYASGTLFGYVGYNRSGYAPSNIRFAGPGYDFTLQNAVAYDAGFDFTRPQYNASVGYYFKDHWAVSLNYDHMRYIFADNNRVNLSGTIDASAEAQWEGTYNGLPVVTHRDTFYYSNENGLDFIRLGITRTDMLVKLGDQGAFAISSNAGISLGGLLTTNEFNFGGREDLHTVSMSGYGLAAFVGLRLEFFRHVFLQSTFTGGFNHQVKVHTRPTDPSSFARQGYGYMMWDTGIGFFAYLRPKNGCDSCPVW